MQAKTELIKDTKYCEIHNQGRYVDNNYTYCIEKIYVKKLKRFEIRFFSLYKDLTGHPPEKFIARSLDVTELEFIPESLHSILLIADFDNAYITFDHRITHKLKYFISHSII